MRAFPFPTLKPSLPKACKLEAWEISDVGLLPACFLLHRAVWPGRLRQQQCISLLERSRTVPEEELNSHVHAEVAAHLVWELLACCSLAEIIATDRNRQRAETKACVKDGTGFHCGAGADGWLPSPLISLSKHLSGAYQAAPHRQGPILACGAHTSVVLNTCPWLRGRRVPTTEASLSFPSM